MGSGALKVCLIGVVPEQCPEWCLGAERSRMHGGTRK